MKKLLICFLLVCGCSFTGTIDISHTFPASEREEWCKDDCEKYVLSAAVISDIFLSGDQPPWCICMHDCMLLDSSYCEVDSTQINSN